MTQHACLPILVPLETFDVSFNKTSVVAPCDLIGFEFVEEDIDGPEWTGFRMTILGIGFLTQVFGNGMMLGILSYEKYGGDPQKRIIVNRLAMQLVYNAMGINMTSMGTVMVRLVFGPLSPNHVLATFLFSNSFFAISALLALNEMAILRFLSIFVWKRLPPLDEDLFSSFFLTINYLISSCLAAWENLGDSEHHETYYILTGKVLMADSNEPMFRFFSIPLLMTIIIHALVGIASSGLKLKNWYEETWNAVQPGINGSLDQENNNVASADQEVVRYNNSHANVDVTTVFLNIITLIAFVAYFFVISSDWEENIILPNILGFAIPIFAVIFILPLKLCLINPIWHHVKTTYLQSFNF